LDEEIPRTGRPKEEVCLEEEIPRTDRKKQVKEKTLCVAENGRSDLFVAENGRSEWRRNKISELQKKKAKAVAEENFEVACQLRDKIIALEEEGPTREELEDMKRIAIFNEDFELAARIRDTV